MANELIWFLRLDRACVDRSVILTECLSLVRNFDRSFLGVFDLPRLGTANEDEVIEF